MPADRSKQMTPETLGTGVYDPNDFRMFSPDEGMVVPMYADDPDVSVVVWNLEPGQENSTHVHPDAAHVQWVLSGSGVMLRGDEPPVPIRAGQCMIIPRGRVHGIRNTGTERLSYLAVTNRHPGGGYVRTPIGEQKVSLSEPGGSH